MSDVRPFEPALTAFMLVKTTPDWLAMPPQERIGRLTSEIAPILARHAGEARLRLFDTEFYSARVTDVWMWEARTHEAYRRLVEELRDTPFWDRYFAILDILPGVENFQAGDLGARPGSGRE